MSDIFDTLRDEFNIEEEKAQIVDKTNEIVSEISTNIEKQKYGLEDKEFIKNELQTLIATNQTVLTSLADQLKMGCPPHMYEVFTHLSAQITDQLMSLMRLSKAMTDYQVVESQEKLKERALEQKERLTQLRIEKSNNSKYTQNNTFNLNSEESLAMVQHMLENAKKESRQLKPEKPEFDLG